MPDKGIVAPAGEGPRHGSIPRQTSAHHLRRGSNRTSHGGIAAVGPLIGSRAATSYRKGSGGGFLGSTRRYNHNADANDFRRCLPCSGATKRWWVLLSVLAAVAVTQQLLSARAGQAAAQTRPGGGHDSITGGNGNAVDGEPSSRPERRFSAPTGAERSALAEVVTTGARPAKESKVPLLVGWVACPVYAACWR